MVLLALNSVIRFHYRYGVEYSGQLVLFSTAQEEKVEIRTVTSPSLSHANTKVDTSVYDKGLALDREGNHTGTIIYFDKALTIDPKDMLALSGKDLALSN
jgi:hypothetical protein